VIYGSVDDYERCISNMKKAENNWKSRPMPERGEIVREIGEQLRKYCE
jgi:acyl-CoA reductase-like NAD-dependent aldehyde dehydrogenase